MMRPETGQEYPLRLGSSILGRQHDSQFCSLRFPFMPQSASRKDPARLDVAQDGGVCSRCSVSPVRQVVAIQAPDSQLLCCRWSCSWPTRTLAGQSCCSRGMLIRPKMIWSAWPFLMGTTGAWSSCRPLYIMPSKAGETLQCGAMPIFAHCTMAGRHLIKHSSKAAAAAALHMSRSGRTGLCSVQPCHFGALCTRLGYGKRKSQVCAAEASQPTHRQVR